MFLNLDTELYPSPSSYDLQWMMHLLLPEALHPLVSPSLPEAPPPSRRVWVLPVLEML